MKKTPLKRKTALTAKSGFKQAKKGHFGASRAIKKPKTKKIKEHWKPPAWFMAIPTGSHGNNPIQKRLWKLTSDFVRIFDFETYGVCASCGKRIENWQDGDCGHYKAWAVCNNYFKFDQINLALQCSNCNRLSDGVTGTNFGETLKKRRGENILEKIEFYNNALHGGKLNDIIIVQMARDLIELFKQTIIKPDYYEKVCEKINES